MTGPPTVARLALVASTTSARSSSNVPFQSQTRCALTPRDDSSEGGSPRGQIAHQAILVDSPVPVLLAVEQQYRDADPVLGLEFVVIGDVDLGPRLAGTRCHPVERLLRHVAEVAERPRVQDEP